MRMCFHWKVLVSVGLAVAFGAGVSRSWAGSTHLTIGNGSAWVRESFPPTTEKEARFLVWTNPPPELDMDTLQVWNVLRPWPVTSWQWAQSEIPLTTLDESAPFVWKPSAQTTPPPVRNRIQVELAAPLSRLMGHSITYRLPQWEWSAFYRIVVRGIGPESIEAVQVDLEASLHIRNGSSAAFSDAKISVIGTDDALRPPPKPFGMLELNADTALTDSWLLPPAALPQMPAAYSVLTVASIPANGVAAVQFAQVLRKPAQVIHVCDSSDILETSRAEGLPLRRELLIPNTEAIGLGFPLPPGTAQIFIGAARGEPNQVGRATHTPFPGVLHLDLGRVDAVRARRQVISETTQADGVRQVEHSIALYNDLTSPVRIVVLEKPAATAQWSLTQSSVPCSTAAQTLRFELTIPPRSSQTITYRLRLAAQKQN